MKQIRNCLAGLNNSRSDRKSMILMVVAMLDNEDQNSISEHIDVVFKYQHTISKDHNGMDEVVKFRVVFGWVVHDGHWNPRLSTCILLW